MLLHRRTVNKVQKNTIYPLPGTRELLPAMLTEPVDDTDSDALRMGDVLCADVVASGSAWAAPCAAAVCALPTDDDRTPCLAGSASTGGGTECAGGDVLRPMGDGGSGGAGTTPSNAPACTRAAALSIAALLYPSDDR